MMASNSYINVGSNSTFLSGNFKILNQVDDFSLTFIDRLVNEIESLSSMYEQELQGEASDTPGWEAYADLMSVDVQGGEIVYSHSGTESDDYEMMVLEFGDMDNPPSPLLRSFSESNQSKFSEDVSNWIKGEVPLG